MSFNLATMLREFGLLKTGCVVLPLNVLLKADRVPAPR